MKIALVFPNNLYTAPYLSYFTQILDLQEISYEFIIWDRNNKKEPNTVAFSGYKTHRNPILRTYSYWKFRNFAIKKLKERKPDKVIVFSAQLGIALSDFLIANYPNQYFLDIRDYSSVIEIFGSRFKRLIREARYTSISSPGFKDWLPKGPAYTLSHNMNHHLIDQYSKISSNKTYFQSSKVKVTTIGALRDVSANTEVIYALGNRDGYNLHFIGDGYALPHLEEFVNSNRIKNVTFYGRYQKKDELDLLDATDFINILLDNNKLSKHLLSNRLYLSALLGIPCIVNADTQQSVILKKYNLGIIVDDYSKLSNLIDDYIVSFDKDQFVANCNIFLNEVKKDYEEFEENILNFINVK